jgi:hypothetical protein
MACQNCGANSLRLCVAAQGLDIVNAFNAWALVTGKVRGVSHLFGESFFYSFGLVCGTCGAYHVNCRKCGGDTRVADLPLHNNAYRCAHCSHKIVVHTNGGMAIDLIKKGRAQAAASHK